VSEGIKPDGRKAHYRKVEEYRKENVDASEKIKQQLEEEMCKLLLSKPVEFDGIQGDLPSWVSTPRKLEFLSRREKLLGQYSISQLMAHKQDFKQTQLKTDPKVGLTRRHWPPYGGAYPDEIEDDLDYLCHLEYCVSLEEKEGLELLDGIKAVDAARGHKSVSSGRDGGITKGENNSDYRKKCCKKAKEIYDKRSKKPSERELARLVVRELHPELNEKEIKKKTDVVRHWF
jgi:hypothetical protein